jgi:hypothetical protein
MFLFQAGDGTEKWMTEKWAGGSIFLSSISLSANK